MTCSQITPLPPVMTLDEVAKILRCDASTVRNYVHSHALVAIKIGRERRFRADDLFEFLAARPSTAKTGG